MGPQSVKLVILKTNLKVPLTQRKILAKNEECKTISILYLIYVQQIMTN